MYCPDCRYPNRPGVDECEHCKAKLSDVRERVAIGAQFAFADASERRPVALSLDGLQPKVYTAPTVVSRHRHDIGLGESYSRPRKRKRRIVRPKPQIDLRRLPAPSAPDLTAVITERKIYRPKEEARIFIVAPDGPGEKIEMEVHLAGQQISKEKVTLDEAGLALRPFSDLEEGEYTVLVRRAGKKEPAQCTFSAAEFTLSPLITLLEDHTYEDGVLGFKLRVIALSVPYTGPVELGLQCAEAGERVVETQKATVRKGLVKGSFDVRKHGGPFRVLLTTPDGETATVHFPGTSKTERERITLCPLGRVAEAGLLPGTDTEEVRGLHLGYDGVENTPLRLESAVGEIGRLVSDIQASVVQVVTFHPLTGETTAAEFRNVKAGDTVEFPVEAPYTLFTAGALASRMPYEAWGVIVHPHGATASLSAPEKAAPGEEIPVRIESDTPASCLFLVYDARLEHESPVPKLAKGMIDALRSSTRDLKEQTAPTLASMPNGPWGYPFRDGMLGGGMMLRSMGAGMVSAMSAPTSVTKSVAPVPDAMPWLQEMGRVPADGDTEAVATVVQAPAFVAAPSRDDFPELAYMELFPVRDVIERTVPLGDQIGTWRCRAYLVSGLDVHELTADVEAAKDVYAELDLPAIVDQGDDILAGVTYHTEQPATMTISLPDGNSISGAVMGHGTETFHLTEPGDVTVHIYSADGDDWTTRSVKPPGMQTVTTSRLDILKKGESVEAERVVVYPGPANVLTETIEALGRYPFG